MLQEQSIRNQVNSILEISRDSITIIALPTNFDKIEKLDIYFARQNLRKSINPIHVTGVSDCQPVDYVLADTNQMHYNEAYLNSFVKIAATFRLANICICEI